MDAPRPSKRRVSPLTRRYAVRLGTAMALYSALLLAGIAVINRFPASPWRYVAAALPIAPLALVVRAVVRFLREADEMVRQVQLEALAFAFGTGSLLTFSYGLLQGVGLPQLSWLWVWPVFAVCWVLGLLLARRRYG